MTLSSIDKIIEELIVKVKENVKYDEGSLLPQNEHLLKEVPNSEIKVLMSMLLEGDMISKYAVDICNFYWNDKIPTACVRLNRNIVKGKRLPINIYINPKFWKSHSIQEQCFIFAHEIAHYALRHGSRTQSIETRKKFLVPYATDAVINDYLIRIGYTAPSSAVTLEKLIYGLIEDDILKRSLMYRLKNKSFEYVINEIYDTLSRYGECFSKEFPKFLEEFTDVMDHEKSDLVDEDKAIENEMLSFFEDKSNVKTNDGSEEVGHLDFIIRPRESKRWVKIKDELIKLNEGEKPKPNWFKTKPRISMASSKVLSIPRTSDKNVVKSKPNVLIFLDTSGSVEKYSIKFLKGIRTLPNRHFDSKIFTFSHFMREWSIKDPFKIATGGTCFHILEDYCRSLPRYPENVFILTDGEASHPPYAHPENWSWFMTPRSDIYKSWIPDLSKIYDLSEFIDL